MQPADLLTICLDRIYGLLREGFWNSGKINPFSHLPSSIVDGLMEVTEKLDHTNPPQLNDVSLLLKSGKLRRLNLRPFDLKEEAKTNMRKLNKRRVTGDRIVKKCNNLVSQILSWNPQIVEAHLSDPTDLILFQNYESLKILRFYDPVMVSSKRPRKRRQAEVRKKRFERYIGSVLPSLSNLEELYIPEIDTDTKIKILETCPKIRSLGFVDTLEATLEITRRSRIGSLSNIEYGSHLQLRRCCWGLDSELHYDKSSFNRQKFSSQVKCAVSLCPLVEELIFYTNYPGVLELKNLKKLTLLRIVFRDFDAGFVSVFIDVLQCIGPLLEHLSVTCDHAIPIDSICEYCPHLESLDIAGPLFVKNSRETSGDLRLKRIRLFERESDAFKETVEFLLLKCKQLEKLELSTVPFLDDIMLAKILKVNPFAKLNWMDICICNLSEEGFDMLLSSAESIRTIRIFSNKARSFYFEKNLLPHPNLKFLKSEESLYREFISQLDDNRF